MTLCTVLSCYLHYLNLSLSIYYAILILCNSFIVLLGPRSCHCSRKNQVRLYCTLCYWEGKNFPYRNISFALLPSVHLPLPLPLPLPLSHPLPRPLSLPLSPCPFLSVYILILTTTTLLYSTRTCSVLHWFIKVDGGPIVLQNECPVLTGETKSNENLAHTPH